MASFIPTLRNTFSAQLNLFRVIQLVLIVSFELFHQAITMAQSPQADFVVQPTACLGEGIVISNTSTNANTYEWDFCLGDFKNLVANNESIAITGLSSGFGYRLIEDNGNWYGFAVSQGGSKIFRLDFGDNPSNTPSIVDLGTMGGLLVFPHEIDLFKNNGSWYGFVTSNEVDFGLVKLNFGNALTNIPSATNIGNFGVTGRIWDIKIVQQGADLVLVMAERNGGTIARVNFRDSFDNLINPAVHVFNSIVITGGGNTAPGFDIVKTSTEWIVLLASHFDSKIYQVSFGADLFSPASIVTSYTFSGVNKPYRVRMAKEGNDFYAAVSNDPSQPTTDPVQLINFNDLNPSNTPVVVSHSGLPELIGVDLIRYKGKGLIQGVGINNNKLKHMEFEAFCGVSLTYGTMVDPPMINYSASGNFNMGLIASANGEFSTKITSITISTSIAPDISFTSQNNCANNDILFTSQNTSGNITDYNWDLGDMSTSMLQDPVHQYSTADQYIVSLQVTSSNGCNNFAIDTLTVYNEPIPTFDLPSASPFCTNQEYLFTNTSTFDVGSNPTWSWEVNGMPVSSDMDLLYSIPSTVMQDVKLKAGIPGCENETTQTINTVEEGPLADFSFTNDCEDTSITFTNQTTGAVSSYLWDFDDGNTSVQINASNTFNDFGQYNVNLQATNAAGCVNNVVKQITIYSKPQPDFSIDLPPFSCSGSPSQFNDLTPNPPDSNLDTWSWTFGDPQNGTSATRNPQYIYMASGDYNVNLDVTTNFGCTASILKQITILDSPSANFSFNPACVNQPTTFTPQSTVGISSWQWKIGTATYSQQSPVHVFGGSSTFNAELTVTGNNGCVAILSKPVLVPVPSSPNFTSTNNCAQQITSFTDTTPTGSDPVASRAWEFGTLGTGTGASPTFSFNSAGSFPTKLTVTNQSGCTYVISKNVTISSSPIPIFTATPVIGTAPLNVQVVNNSANVISQFWSVNDPGNSTSNAATANFVFNELGQYIVDLTVSNAQGCSATASKIISVIVPSLDLELTSLTLSPSSTGELNFMLSLKNKSNTPIANPKALIDISGQVQVNEIINAVIQPGATHTQVLTTGIAGARNGIDYVCVELLLDGDFDLSNNKLCLSQGTNTVVLDPYPNPGNDNVTLEWVAEQEGKADIYIFDPVGRKVFDNSVHNFLPGLNRITIPLQNLHPGIYHILFVADGTRQSFRYMVRR